MKKDFTQPLINRGEVQRGLLIKNNGKFLVEHSTEEYEEEFYSVPYLAVPSQKIDRGRDVDLQLLQFLEEMGLSLVSSRELARRKTYGYSFIDETSGSTSEETCYVVEVDVHDGLQNPKNGYEYSWLPPEELLQKLRSSPYGFPLAQVGLVQLIAESK